MSQTITRSAFIAAGLGLSAAALTARPVAAEAADAHALTETEQANVKLVEALFAEWNNPNLDLDKFVARYMAPQAIIRWSDDMQAAGPEAAAKQLKAGMPPGARVSIKVHKIFARGPVVATARTDTMKVPGKPDALFEVAGVHIVKDGKIQEYCDYLIR